MKIFTDLHHGDLYFSLHLLFERRLGFELYRPIGLEWFDKGYWKIAAPYKNPRPTINQYLSIRPGVYDQYKNLNGQHYLKDDIYHVSIPGHDYYQKAITLEKFESMDFDIIMPTFPGHGSLFESLRNKYQPKAKIIMQMGNAGQKTHLPNVLHSNAYDSKPGQHCRRYHQEINPDLFHYVEPPANERNIYSVVNCAPYIGIYKEYKQQVTDANWKYYGASSPDGALSGAKGVSKKMKEANIAWHLKPQGGVGHSTKGWFAIGRPLVTNMSQHKKAGGDTLALFEPGVTCIDLDSGTVQENIKKIRKLLDPEINLHWSKRVNKRFKDIIDYDRDEQRIRKFLENLK
jgi:hypothetical protein